jgi:hypothetical protein
MVERVRRIPISLLVDECDLVVISVYLAQEDNTGPLGVGGGERTAISRLETKNVRIEVDHRFHVSDEEYGV